MKNSFSLKSVKSQVSMEFLMTMGMMVFIFISILVITQHRRTELFDFEDEIEFKSRCEKISHLITNVYFLGDGTSITSEVEYNFTVFGSNRQIMVWDTEVGRNKTYLCSYPIYNVTNRYNTSFTVPEYTNFTVRNVDGNVQILRNELLEDVVLYLSFDEINSSGGALDESPFGNDAAMADNALVNQSSLFGYGLQVDGDGDYAEIPDDSSYAILGNMSWSFWFRDTGGGATRRPLLYKNTEFYFRIWDNDQLYNYIYIGGDIHACRTPFAIPQDQEWHHLVVTLNYDGTNYYKKSYLDSVTEEDMTCADGALGDTTNVLRLGSNGGVQNFTGTIDEFRIYNRTLTDAEVNETYINYLNYAVEQGDELIR